MRALRRFTWPYRYSKVGLYLLKISIDGFKVVVYALFNGHGGILSGHGGVLNGYTYFLHGHRCFRN